jgi:tetratricopeptide (TPR) repeat protein
MERYMEADARFMLADELMNQGKFAEAKEMLTGILEDEPDYGMAHNHLGWIYWTRLTDYERAAKHLRLAVRFSPNYPSGYINYCFLLLETGEYGKVLEVAQSALQVKGVAKTQVFRVMAYANEMTEDLGEAVKLLKSARAYASDEEMMKILEGDIKRVKRKMSTSGRLALMLSF